VATYVSNSDLKDYFAGQLRLKDGSSALPSGIPEILYTRANQAAFDEILAKLRGRGYSREDIDQWDRREEFNLDLGTYWLLRSAANLEADDTWPEKFNRRAELDDLILTIDGEPVELVSGESNIAHGRLDDFENLSFIDDDV